MARVSEDEETLLTDLRKHVRHVELWIEERPAAHIIVKIGGAILALTVVLLDIYNLFGSRTVTLWVLFIIITALLFLDYGHVVLARRRRLETLARDEDIRILSNVILHARQNLEAIPHTKKSVSVTRELQENGDVTIRKTQKISCTEDPVLLIFSEAWLVGSPSGVDPKHLGFSAKNKTEGTQLMTVLVEDKGTAKTFAVVLDPPATKGRDFVLETTHRWPGAWKTLFLRDEDFGELEVNHETELYELFFVLPTGWVFTQFSINPHCPTDKEIRDDETGHSTLRVLLSDLSASTKYRFRVRCSRQPSN